MTYTAIFRDGPLGGQYREVMHADYVILVPAFRRISVSQYETAVEEPVLPLDEEYRLEGARGSLLEYRWVNPADPLRSEVARLRDKIAKAKEALGC